MTADGAPAPRAPSVMMVTGAYFPEASGAGLQCRALIHACGDRVRFTVLTTAVDSSLPPYDVVDGVRVRRVLVSARSRAARLLATPRLIRAAWTLMQQADIVHLHGFSAKSRVVVTLARLLGRRIIVKLTSVGDDDAVSMKRRGRRTFASFARADRFVGVSPRFGELQRDAGLSLDRFHLIANGVDLERFRPPAAGERERLRQELGLPLDLPIVLFVGFFSREKQPDVMFDAWTDAFGPAQSSALVMLGRTRGDYHEIDPAYADRIRRDADRLGCADRLILVEHTAAIEQYYRAADVLMLPSLREGLPNVVLEAMASGLACVVSRLPGVTDSLIADSVDGVLVEPRDRTAYAAALRRLVDDEAARARLGAAARQTAAARFSLADVASKYVSLYESLIPNPQSLPCVE